GEDVNLNTGDADTFRRFITFCKTYYPAKKYAVFVGGHGIGAVEEKVSRSNEPLKAMAQDKGNANEDWIFTAELTDAFDDNESVDLLVLDCCTMGFAEVAYQYRPGNGSFNTKYLLASLPQQVGAGLFYEDIFKNVTPTMSAVEFGKLILTQQEAYIKSTITDYWAYSYTEIVAMALYDCSKIEELKNVIDEAVPYLSDKMFLVQNTASRSCGYWRRSYMTGYADYMFDIYDLFTRLSDTTNDLSVYACSKCAEVAQLADDIVLGSFLLKEQTTQYQYPFENDHSGIAIFLPQNESLWRTTLSYNSNYIPDVKDAMGITMNGYGNFAWCIDGCEPSDNIADNWFELLDSWYDTTNDESGGLNYYQY
ncbi:MAG: hypothetical protein J6W76_00360, partial [Spirochaetales bacterium]|nr:hypothetical protein [Spirochaetales bacterium]